MHTYLVADGWMLTVWVAQRVHGTLAWFAAWNGA
jgi:hypothetical protein